MRRSILGCAILLGVLTAAPVARADLYLQGYDAARHNRFYAGADKAFIGEDFDWSGVGQVNGGTWAIMISPQYFVSANHWHPGGGNTLTFYEDNTLSNPHTYTVDSWGFNNGDLYLGRLTAPISAADNICFYPILSLPSAGDYVGLEVYINGKPNRVGMNVISSAYGSTVTYRYDAPSPLGGDEAYLVGGDSGGPTFVDARGELALIGTHYWNYGNPPPSNGWYSGDSFVPYSIDWLDGMMGGVQVRLVDFTPEPSAVVMLLGLGGLGLLVGVRRRKA